MITLLVSDYLRFIFYFDYCSFTGVDSVSLQVTCLLYVHGFIMMNPLFKAILNSTF